jgi:hypothetical protein
MNHEHIRILYVDDSRLDRELVRYALVEEHGGFDLTEAASREEFETCLQKGPYDLVLSDFNILGFEGLQVLDTVKRSDPALPVVIVTGTGSEEVAVEAMKRGAADYVLKTTQHIRRLPHTIEAALHKQRLEAERRRAEEALRRSEEQYRAIFEATSDAMLVLGVDGLIRDVNPAACHMYGYKRSALIGWACDVLVSLEVQELVHQAMQTLNAGETLTAYTREYQRGGTSFDAEVRILPFTYGGMPHLLGMIRNVTESKRLERELLEVGERERRRIGQDLHDDLGQVLIGVGFRLAELRHELEEQHQIASGHLEVLEQMVESAVLKTRTLAQGLNPISVGAEGLVSALGQMAQRIEQVFSIPCTFTCPPPIPTTHPEVAMQVYRIAQEAINNTLKHSKATRIDMSLYAREGRLDLTIKDNGIGINRASGKPSGGMGLRIMEFRARMINATLDLRQPPEGGTLVLCTLRLASPEPTGGSP